MLPSPNSTTPNTPAQLFEGTGSGSNGHSAAVWQITASDEERGADFQAKKTSFFFKLERELEKVCANVVLNQQHIDSVSGWSR